MIAKVEITRGWGGDEVIKETVVSDADMNTLDIKASKWLRANVPDPRNIQPYWTMTGKDGGVIVDYGSYIYFGRFTVLQGDTSVTKSAAQTRNKTMSKKKPYSRVENGKLLRKLQFEAARDTKTLVKEGAPEWFVRLHAEYIETATRLTKLEDFLWVRDIEGSDVRPSDEARAICPTAYKLLIKQVKAMLTYAKILKARVDLGWPETPGVCECKKCKKADAKKPVKKAK